MDIFFSDDVRQALQAADEACLSTAGVCAVRGGDRATLRAYLEGYRAALRTIALAFGLSPTVITTRGPDLVQCGTYSSTRRFDCAQVHAVDRPGGSRSSRLPEV